MSNLKMFNKIKNEEVLQYNNEDLKISTQKRVKFDQNGKKVPSGKRYILFLTIFNSKIVLEPEMLGQFIDVVEKMKIRIETKQQLDTIVELPFSIGMIQNNERLLIRYTNELKTYSIAVSVEEIISFLNTLKDLEKELKILK